MYRRITFIGHKLPSNTRMQRASYPYYLVLYHRKKLNANTTIFNPKTTIETLLFFFFFTLKTIHFDAQLHSFEVFKLSSLFANRFNPSYIMHSISCSLLPIIIQKFKLHANNYTAPFPYFLS
jgi:hypothetical protein